MDMFSSHTVAGLNIWQINYQFCHLTVLRKYHHGVILICLDSDFYQITKYIIVCFFYKDKNYLIKIIFSPWNIILKNKLKIGWRKMKHIVINIFRIISLKSTKQNSRTCCKLQIMVQFPPCLSRNVQVNSLLHRIYMLLFFFHITLYKVSKTDCYWEKAELRWKPYRPNHYWWSQFFVDFDWRPGPQEKLEVLFCIQPNQSFIRANCT